MRSHTELPEDEIRFLQALPRSERDSRLAALHDYGWSLASLGRSFIPTKPKTTIHYWIRHSKKGVEQRRELPKPPPTSLTMAVPTYKAPIPRSISPKVPPDMRPRLRELATLSRRYRAKTPKSSPLALANQELTQIALQLHAHGVPTSDIAAAAGVSYRAMARRIAINTQNLG